MYIYIYIYHLNIYNLQGVKLRLPPKYVSGSHLDNVSISVAWCRHYHYHNEFNGNRMKQVIPLGLASWLAPSFLELRPLVFSCFHQLRKWNSSFFSLPNNLTPVQDQAENSKHSTVDKLVAKNGFLRNAKKNLTLLGLSTCSSKRIFWVFLINQVSNHSDVDDWCYFGQLSNHQQKQHDNHIFIKIKTLFLKNYMCTKYPC